MLWLLTVLTTYIFFMLKQEFRYYLVATLFLQLHYLPSTARESNEREISKSKSKSKPVDSEDLAPLWFGRWSMWMNVVGYLVFDVALLYIFLYRPFTWPDSSVARFLW